MSATPASLDQYSMTWRHWAAVIICMLLNALDGFDVLSISFAAPAISKDWQLAPSALGWLLSMELIGMGAGSVLLGGVADKLGRKQTILGCLLAMTAGMYGAAHATDMQTLLSWRLVAGVGIGGMLASINALTSEVSNARWRSLSMALMVLGYPLGGVLGGLAISPFMATGNWRGIFFYGAVASAIMLPVVLALIPDTRQATASPTAAGAGRVTDIFRKGLLGTTLVLALAYVGHITSFYFVLKWVPKLVVDMGFTPKAAGGVLTITNVGSVIGCLAFGIVAARSSVKTVTQLTMLGTAAMIIVFGQGHATLGQLQMVVVAAGFFINSAVTGMYTLFATEFPAHLRATGTGFCIGIGRGGAALAPVLAGYLLQAGLTLPSVAVVMCCGSLIGAALLYWLPQRAAAQG
jgi:MFS family permease